jgi:hypothetical protein
VSWLAWPSTGRKKRFVVLTCCGNMDVDDKLLGRISGQLKEIAAH